MSGKNQYPTTFQWQSTNPAVGFLPLIANQTGTQGSGVINGAMTGNNTIYSQILEISRMDNMGLEVTWTGTPVGNFYVMVSNSGINFYSLTFNPVLTQPSGFADGYAIDLNQLPFKYMSLLYINSSGSGLLTVYGQSKDLN